MSFEQEFPSFDDFPERTFRELFPSVSEVYFRGISRKLVYKNIIKGCLDKQRVREVINSYFPNKDTIQLKYGSLSLKEQIIKELGL